MAQRVVNWHKCAGARAQYDTKNTKVGRVLIYLKPKFISTEGSRLMLLLGPEKRRISQKSH